ncbi:MAG TPA: DUF433 domain-containing protein [Chloroflexota bacterium]|nr:DUF433 domain-containing protein [Chloroflexota bacterium]
MQNGSTPEHPYVSETPGVCGGYPVVRGTRTPVRLLVEAFRELGEVEATQAAFPHLTIEQVRGALAYYAAHPARVDADFERHARVLAERQGRQWPG